MHEEKPFSLAEKPGDPGASPIGRVIAERIRDRRCRFVFPTQVSADSWAEAALDFPGISCVEKSRFLGWDAFLEERKAASIPQGYLRADARSRLLWSLSLLGESNQGDMQLFSETPQFKPGIAFASTLANLAPELQALSVLPESELPESARGLDVSRIAQRYRDFMRRHSIYEFSGLPVHGDAESHHVLFMPSLMPGFSESGIAGCNQGRMELVEVPMATENVVLNECETFREEVDAVLAACAHFLKEGVQAGEIALSIPSQAPSMQAHLALAARKIGVALDFRAGVMLSRSPAGTLLRALQAAASEGFSTRTLRRLLDPCVAHMKDRSSGLALLAFAESHNIPESSADRQHMTYLWNRTFALCATDRKVPAPDSVRLFYDRLRAATLALSGAKDFSSLRAAFHDFMDDFIVEQDKSTAAERMLERIYSELDSLEAWHALTGKPPLAASPFDTLILHLGRTRYGHAQAEGSIAVYPFHLGLALASKLHLVLDLSQDSTTAAAATIMRGRLRTGGKDEVQQTDEKILGSMNSVSAVYFHAASGLSGYTVPHPWFSRPHAALRSFSFTMPDLRAERISDDGAESVSDAGKSHDPARLQTLPAAWKSPWFKFSPSSLGKIEECPFKWFMACIPLVESRMASTVPMAEGNLLHSLICSILTLIEEKDGFCHAGNIETYLRWLDEILPREMAGILRSAGPALQDALETGFPRLKSRIATLLQREAEFQADGWNAGTFEIPLSSVFEESGILLSGRADRIASRTRADGSEEFAIIDYKRDSTPKRGDFLVDDEGSLKDFQLASYSTMLEGQGRQVERAMYWSVEQGKLVVVFGPGGKIPARSEFEPQMAALKAALLRAACRIRDGRFLDITPSPAACRNCDARPMCRARFATEHRS